MTTAPAPAAVTPRLPRQIAFIIGNEAGERFGFYGMRNILTVFLAQWMFVELAPDRGQAQAKEVFHIFVMGVYFFPLLGGWIADRVWGRYLTIMRLSVLYTLGYALLAAFVHDRVGFYLGLFLIAFGSGGIKPCVSTFVGDQFDQSTKSRAKVVFDAFYMSINLGSLFASFFIPWVLTGGSEPWRPRVAFGIPGVVMAVATLVFWLGRRQYVRVPPAPADPHGVLNVAWTAIRTARASGDPSGMVLLGAGAVGAVGALVATPVLGVVPALCLSLVLVAAGGGLGAWRTLPHAAGHHPEEDLQGTRVVLRLLVVFALVTPFWSLFDQKASTWVLQGQAMALPPWLSSPAQMQALNPLLVMVLIPLNHVLVFPLLRRLGLEPTPLRRMATGIALSSVSWLVIGVIQLAVADAQGTVSVLWQALPYAILTYSEVLVSATGLEFAYSQAPARTKSVVSAINSLAVTVGNLWVLLVGATVQRPEVIEAIRSRGLGVMAFQMFFFAGFAAVAALAFALYARRYRMADYYRPAT